jgi:hypothetical protein
MSLTGGKSLVAEVLMVRQLLARSAGVRPPAFGQRRQPPPRAMLVLPYIRLAVTYNSQSLTVCVQDMLHV